MSFGHVADVDAAMPKRYGVLAVIGILPNEFGGGSYRSAFGCAFHEST
jgi:hypothetical protein